MNKKLLVIALVIMVFLSINVVGSVFALEPEANGQETAATPGAEQQDEQTLYAAPPAGPTPSVTPEWVASVAATADATKVDPANLVTNLDAIIAAGGNVTGGTITTAEDGSKTTQGAVSFGDSEPINSGLIAVTVEDPAPVPDFKTEAVTVEEGATSIDPRLLFNNAEALEAAGYALSGGAIETDADGNKTTFAVATLNGIDTTGEKVTVLENVTENNPPVPEDAPEPQDDLTKVTGLAKADMNITFYGFRIAPKQDVTVKNSKDVVINQEMNILIQTINPAPIFVERYNYYGYSYGAETTIPRTGDPTSLFSLLGLTLSGAGIAILRKQK